MIVNTDDKDYLRDLSSKALINTNVKALEDYRARKNNAKRLDNLEKEVIDLKSSLDNITTLLNQLVNR